jgi:hypothetical protein
VVITSCMNIDNLITSDSHGSAPRRSSLKRERVLDIKPRVNYTARPNVPSDSPNAHDATDQFQDIFGATGNMPVPLYYRLWVTP